VLQIKRGPERIYIAQAIAREKRKEAKNPYPIKFKVGQKVRLKNGQVAEIERYIGHNQYVLKGFGKSIFHSSCLTPVTPNKNLAKKK
jgi:hypothetical protein